MPANVSQKDGKLEAITTLTPAWWDRDKEYVADHYLLPEEIWEKGGLLCHEYEVRPVREDQRPFKVIPDFLRTVRKDTGVTLGMGMKKGYKVVQPREAFGWMDSLMKDGVMRYASAGVLGQGEQIWVLGVIPESDSDRLAIDKHNKFILWLDDFTGSRSLLWFPCFTRVECENTVNIAKGEREKDKFKGIRHTGDMNAKLEAARKAIIESEAAFQRYNADCKQLIEAECSKVQAREFIAELLPVPLDDKGQPKEGRSATIRERKVQAVRDAMRHPSNRKPDMVGTWWQLVNSVSFAVDHGNVFAFRGQGDKRKLNRWKSLMTGDGADLKAKALDLALAMSS